MVGIVVDKHRRRQTIPQGFQRGQAIRLTGHIMAKVVDGKIVRDRG